MTMYAKKTLSLLAGASLLALAAGPAVAGTAGGNAAAETKIEGTEAVGTHANGTPKLDKVRAEGQTGAEIKADLDKAGKAVSDTAQSVAAAASDAATAAETKVRELMAGDSIDTIEGTAVRDIRGESIGEVGGVVRAKTDNDVYFVVDVGGFLGLGEREVAVPAREFTRAKGHFVLASATKAEMEQRAEYQADMYMPVEVDAEGAILN